MKRLQIDIKTQGACYYACCEGGTCEHPDGPELCGRPDDDYDAEWKPNDPPPANCPLPDAPQDIAKTPTNTRSLPPLPCLQCESKLKCEIGGVHVYSAICRARYRQQASA